MVSENWQGSQEAWDEIAGSVETWARQFLEVLPAGQSEGLDEGQLIEHWGFWRFAVGGEGAGGSAAAVHTLPELLDRLGVTRQSWGEGEVQYTWWSVKPVGWLPGRRRISKDLVEKAGEECFEQQNWAWQEFSTFGEAMAWLLWMRLGPVESGGAPGDELGIIDSTAVEENLGLYIGVEGDSWQWKAADKSTPFGAGRFGLSLTDLNLAQLLAPEA